MYRERVELYRELEKEFDSKLPGNSLYYLTFIQGKSAGCIEVYYTIGCFMKKLVKQKGKV